jgi:hypothetical protein
MQGDSTAPIAHFANGREGGELGAPEEDRGQSGSGLFAFLGEWWRDPAGEPLISPGLVVLLCGVFAPLALAVTAHHDRIGVIATALQLVAVVLGAPALLLDRIEELPGKKVPAMRRRLSAFFRWFLRHRRLLFVLTVGLAVVPFAALVILNLVHLAQSWMLKVVANAWLGASVAFAIAVFGFIAPARLRAAVTDETPVITLPEVVRAKNARLAAVTVAFFLLLAGYSMQLVNAVWLR